MNMGMFDEIKNQLFCPYCGTRQESNTFQTKDFQKCLFSYDIYKVKGINYTIYKSCTTCNNWIELLIDSEGIHTLEEGQKQITKRKKELAKLFSTRKKAQKSTTKLKASGHNTCLKKERVLHNKKYFPFLSLNGIPLCSMRFCKWIELIKDCFIPSTCMKSKKIAILIYNCKGSNIWNRAKGLFSKFPSNFKISFIHRTSTNFIDSMRFFYLTLAKKPDVIYMMDIGFPSLFTSSLIKVLSFGKTEVILDSGDLVYQMTKDNPKHGYFAETAVYFIELFSYRIADKIIVRGKPYRNYLEDKGYKKNKIFYIPDGTYIKLFKPVKEKRLRKELGLDNFLVLGTMGTLYWDSRYNNSYGYYLIRAMDCLRKYPVKAIIIGDGEGKAHLKSIVSWLNLEDKVIFIKKVQYIEVPKYLGLIDVFVYTCPHYPNNDIRTGGKLPELLSTGKFIIASDVTESKRLITENGFVLPFNGVSDERYHIKIASKVKHILRNRKIIEKGKKGIETARQFDYNILSKELQKIISK